MGKQCIEVEPTSTIAYISESLCIGCGICPKKCPFDAITIVNLPTNLESQTTHRYAANTFKLHRLPTPKAGHVLGLVGTNGIGKSTALKILSGKLKPNLGKYDVRMIITIMDEIAQTIGYIFAFQSLITVSIVTTRMERHLERIQRFRVTKLFP
jgi:translation initiation factor RLI1